MSPRLRWSWLAVLVILVGGLAYGTLDDSGPRSDAERVRALSDRIACPQCSGQSVAESDVTIARVIRTDIAERVDAGQTDDEIVAELKASYGDDIDLNPSATGLTGVVWVLPVAVLIGGLALVVAVLQRWRRAPSADDDAEAASAAPAPGARSGLRRWAAPVAIVAVVAVAAGFGVARSSGTRSASDGLTGDIRASSRTLLVDARSAMAAGDHELAIETYDEVLELEPSNPEATAYRSWNLYLSGDVDAARDGLDEAVTLDETYPDALAFRAILRVRTGDARGGLDDLLALQSMDPGEGVSGFIVPTAFEAADALLVSRDLDGVLEAYTLVLEREPENAAALSQRGWIFGQAELYDRALADLDAAVAVEPDSAVTLAFRAAIRAESGDLEGAAADIAAFDALDAAPDEAAELVDRVRADLGV